MDLTQVKLTRIEWDSIEVPVSECEKEILTLIMEGFSNINITKNKTMSLFSFTKIERTTENELFLYNKYFGPVIKKTMKKYGDVAVLHPMCAIVSQISGPLKKMKSVDILRIQNLESNIEINKKYVFEFLILDFCNELCRYLAKENTKYAYYLYTLIHLAKASIENVNSHVLIYMNKLISLANEITNMANIVERAYIFIEKNPYLLEYEDKTLFEHQKQLFSVFGMDSNASAGRLVLYIAPTGTGKTLSPIGLSVKYRIIFVCVARHIGLALAKSAISMEKKIAFAFGAETASDIRLHYFAASDYTKDWRSGGIRKVNNAIGDKVEIMICDVQSYLIAMRYMLAFNHEDKIITYWDEPTITMDYESHDLHTVIHENWVQNKIPNIVLSCATLPKEEEIFNTIADFRSRFDGAEVHTISSYDCRKSIPIITKDGFCAVPHTMYESHSDLIECANYCAENKTLLRYFDLSEIVTFVSYINKKQLVGNRFMMQTYFSGISAITMISLKLYYLDILQQIDSDMWALIYKDMKALQKPKFGDILKKNASIDSSISTLHTGGAFLSRTQSLSYVRPPITKSNGILLTTADAYTLTDGPTIFLTEDAIKIGNFYTQQSEIPKCVFQDLLQKIKSNDKLSAQLEELEKKLEDKSQPDSDKKTKQKEKDVESEAPALRDLYKKIDALRSQVRTISLDSVYVPNTTQHQMQWNGKVEDSAFCPNISEDSIKEIMGLYIDNSFKVLMLLGIGIFVRDVDAKYLELMKRLASNQELFIIIASSDFVFGTNYNFCHGFIGKDMTNMTQAKTIQCLGRIGRSAIQSTYTVRFRDDEFIYNLFKTPKVNMEAVNMSKLFST